MPFNEVRDNFARWCKMGFGTVGRVEVTERVFSWKMVLEVDHAGAVDPDYVAGVQRAFQRDFVTKGWNMLAVGRLSVRLLAGDPQDGKPPAQLVVMPSLAGGHNPGGS